MEILPLSSDRYTITGGDFQQLVVNVEPGTALFSEPGAMIFMEDGVVMKTGISGGGSGFLSALGSAISRKLSGESLFLVRYEGQGRVGLAPEFAGKILPVKLEGETLLCQRGAFLAAIGNINVSVKAASGLLFGTFGKEGLLFQKLSGEGIVFLSAFGDLVPHVLEGRKLLINPGCLVAASDTLNLSVRRLRGIRNVLFGGEDFFLISVEGSGLVVTQSNNLRSFLTRLRELEKND